MPDPSALDQIAEHCGVSKNTVSAILRMRPGYAAKTVARVKAAAEALDYRPNPMVSALMRGLRHSRPGTMQGNLAYLSPGANVTRPAGDFRSVLFEAARERARTLGFELDLIAIEPGQSNPGVLNRMLRARGIEGLVVGPMADGRKHLSLDWSRHSSVALGFSLIRPELHRVATNQYHVMALAFRALRHLGYRRIGVCLRPEQNARFDFAWQAGLMTVQATLPRTEKVPALICDDLHVERFSKWFRRHRPDAVVAAGHGLGAYLEQFGLKIPEDVGLVDLTGSPGRNAAATVARDWPALGSAAIDHLAGMLLRNEKGVPRKPTRTLINGIWSPGYSVRRQDLRQG